MTLARLTTWGPRTTALGYLVPVPLMDLLRFLPLSYISWFLGVLANLLLPQPLARWTIGIFISAYGIDATDATKPISSFNSIGEFFTRDLRPELRPMGNGLVSPVDGTLRDQVDLSPGMQVPQVKGKDYTLSELLGDDPLVERFESGKLWNLYLSPKDAHHIHAPFAGRIVKTTRIPGKLWPVNDWALNSIDRLFAVNERVITFIETEQGLLAVVMVGATNVGRISLSYMDLETNLRPWARKIKQSISHESPITIKAGQKIGTFKMGSSVILISEQPISSGLNRNLPCAVKYGESL
jgi:phosphatidylserine decarboxylase